VKAWRSALAAVTATAALTGCGVLDQHEGNAFTRQPTVKILAAAKRDMAAMRSAQVHSTGWARLGNRVRPVSADLQMNRAGACTGTLTLGRGRILLRSPGRRAGYFYRTDAELLVQGGVPAAAADRVIAAVGPRWIKATSRQLTTLFGSLCHLEKAVRLRTPARGAKQQRDAGQAAISELDGRKVVEVQLRLRRQRSRVWVAIDAPHLVLRYTSVEHGRQSSGSLSLVDVPFRVEAPRLVVREDRL
jgi:hypothetical protein